MRLIKETSPYIHRKSSVKRMMLDVLIALIPVVLFAIVINGWNALYVILLSLVPANAELKSITFEKSKQETSISFIDSELKIFDMIVTFEVSIKPLNKTVSTNSKSPPR